ncbi:MAG: hypothetical protein CMI73_01890 [Candidatus Pelagibacter sp.]|nr:hypothetical protein [Candidatus Pelagibacter sp.]|tara:strand:- start:23703 stop:24485 length:783 start_codon:yes stop_codon:yes gene_type:complete
MYCKVLDNIIGYDKELSFFLKLHKNNNLPNTILFQGLDGIGKYTFVVHLINLILKNKSLTNLEENLINNHNILILKKKDSNKEFKFDEVKRVINFCKLKSFNEESKYIVIKNCNFLNKSSVNALLKLTEEAKDNIYFFFTSHFLSNNLKTLESRFFKKKLFLNYKFYKEIIINYFKKNNINISDHNIVNDDTPGNYIRKYLFNLDGDLINLKKNDEDLFYKIISEKIISKFKEDHVSILKKIKINLTLKNDINNILSEFK